MRLLNRHTLTVKRKASGEGHYNDNGDWVSDTNVVNVLIKGNLQPYIKGSVLNGTQLVLPEGVRLTDTRILFSGAKLRTSDDVSWVEADLVVVDGLDYEVFMTMDWSLQLQYTSHYEYIIIRRDKMNATRNK
ncbi:minor capsid protein [Yersinia phage vB_YenM_P778]